MADTEFELEISPSAKLGEYDVHVLSSASGAEPQAKVILDVDVLGQLSRDLDTTVLASAARPRGRFLTELEKPLRQVGSQLFASVFAGPVAAAYRASLAVARERGESLRIVLRIAAPELTVMPWEALYDPELGAYVCRTEPLVRHIDAPYTPEPLPIRPPLRILGIIASPCDLPALDVATERRHLDDALAELIATGQVIVDWLTQASWSAVHERLLRGHWHVVHFIGHGDFDPLTGEGSIALVTDTGRADWVTAAALADLFDEAVPAPRLAVLNSCASAQSGSHDLFSGTAATLVRRGISAVAAMQFSVSDIAAVAFPRGFYTALAAGRSIDEAVRSGRIEILGTGRGTLEWVTPVLYVRGNATELFDVTPPPPTTESQSNPPPDSPAPERNWFGKILHSQAGRRRNTAQRQVITLAVVMAVLAIAAAGLVTFRQSTNQHKTSTTSAPPVGSMSTFEIVRARIDVGQGPRGVAVDPVQQKIYVANAGSNSVSVIDADKFTPTSQSVPPVNSPVAIASDPGTGTTYIANLMGQSISVIGRAPNKSVPVVPCPVNPLPIGTSPHGLAVNTDTATVYVAGQTDGHGTLAAVDGAVCEALPSVDVEAPLDAVAVDRRANRLYACSFTTRSVWVYRIDRTTAPPTLAYEATVRERIGANPNGVAVDSTAHRVYVANHGDESVSVIDSDPESPTFNTVVRVIPVAGNPSAVAVNENPPTVFVTREADDRVDVINGDLHSTTYGKIIDTVPVRAQPSAVAVSPRTGTVYVANRGDGSITVFKHR